METKPDQPTDNPIIKAVGAVGDAVDVEAVVTVGDVRVSARKPAKAKAARKRKTAAARRQRSKQAAEPVAKKELVAEKKPLTTDEIRETFTDVKTQIVEVGLEPARAAFTAWSETIRDAVGGFMSGLLGEKDKKGN